MKLIKWLVFPFSFLRRKGHLLRMSPVSWAALVFVICFCAVSEFFHYHRSQDALSKEAFTFPSIIYHQFLDDQKLASALFSSGNEKSKDGLFCRFVSSQLSIRPDIVGILKIDTRTHMVHSCHYLESAGGLRREDQQISAQIEKHKISSDDIFLTEFPSLQKLSHFAAYYTIFQKEKRVGVVVFVYRSNDFFVQTIPSYLANNNCVKILDENNKILAMNNICSINIHQPAHGEHFSSGRLITIRENDRVFHFYVRNFATADDLWESYWRLSLWFLIFICLATVIFYRSKSYSVNRQRQDLLSLSLVTLCVLDANFRFKRVNEIFTNYAGSMHNVIDRPLLHFVAPESRDLVSENLSKIKLGITKCVFFEAEFIFDTLGAEHGNPKRYWLVWEIRVSSEGECFSAIAQDLTEHKRIERALLKERAFRQAIGDSMTTGIQVTNMDGLVTYVNPAFSEMAGYSLNECLGAHFPFPYDFPPSHCSFNEFVVECWERSRLHNGLDIHVQKKDKSNFEAHLYVSPLTDQNQRRFGWIFSVIDVTEKNRVRRILEANHQQFTTVLNSLEAAVCVFDQLQLRILFYNAYYQKNFGSSPDMHLQLCRSVPKASRAGSDQYASAEVYVDSLHRWFEVRVRLIPWIDDRQHVIMSVSTDITKRKQAEQLYQQQQEKVQQTSHLITMGEMASSLAHELNQPLTAISNYSTGSISRLESGSMTLDEVLRVMRKTSLQAERAGRIIRSIRDFVKKNEPRFFLCNMKELLAEAVEFSEVDASKRKIAIELIIDGELPCISVDPILIQQVLINLLKNAMDAMQDSIDRLIRVVVVAREDNVLEISVIDRGSGIDSDLMDKLFAPFFTTKTEGMGMGLNICRSIIEYHKGRLWAENNPDGGSTFRFTLPYVIE